MSSTYISLAGGRNGMNLPIPTKLDWTVLLNFVGLTQQRAHLKYHKLWKSSVSPIFRQFYNRSIMRFWFWFTKHLKVHSCVSKLLLEPLKTRRSSWTPLCYSEVAKVTRPIRGNPGIAPLHWDNHGIWHRGRFWNRRFVNQWRWICTTVLRPSDSKYN